MKSLNNSNSTLLSNLERLKTKRKNLISKMNDMNNIETKIKLRLEIDDLMYQIIRIKTIIRIKENYQ